MVVVLSVEEAVCSPVLVLVVPGLVVVAWTVVSVVLVALDLASAKPSEISFISYTSAAMMDDAKLLRTTVSGSTHGCTHAVSSGHGPQAPVVIVAHGPEVTTVVDVYPVVEHASIVTQAVVKQVVVVLELTTVGLQVTWQSMT